MHSAFKSQLRWLNLSHLTKVNNRQKPTVHQLTKFHSNRTNFRRRRRADRL